MEFTHHPPICNKKPFIGGNWKMNGSLSKIKQVAAEFADLFEHGKVDFTKGVLLMVSDCPS